MICVAAVAQRRRCSDGVRIKKRAPVLRELFLKIFPQQEKDLITPPQSRQNKSVCPARQNKFVSSSTSHYRSRAATEVQRGEEETKLIWS